MSNASLVSFTKLLCVLFIRMEEILKAPAFVIHMDIPESKDRKPFFMNSLTNAGFTDIRVSDGVDVRTDELLKNALVEYKLAHIGENYLTRGQIGCHFAHMKVLQTIVDKNIPIASIFEDDVFFHPQWKTLSKEYYDKTPKDYDVVWMGSQCDSKDKDLPEIVSIPSFCTHAYIVTNKGAQIILSLFRDVSNDPEHICYNMFLDCVLINHMDLIQKFKKKQESEYNRQLEEINKKPVWLKLGMKNKLNVNESFPNSFVWYNWNGRKYPCEESENSVSHRNDGLAFQSDTFTSLILLSKE